jgi:hypothetical protein
LDIFLGKYLGKNRLDIQIELSDEIDILDKRYKKNELDDEAKNYRTYGGEFLFFLNTVVVPANIGISGLKDFLPIITELVNRGDLPANVLVPFGIVPNEF